MVERVERYLNANQEYRAAQLNPGEQSVLGYFKTREQARQALQQIRRLGFETASLDFLGNRELSMDPVSHPFLVTVVADQQKYDQIRQLMQENQSLS